MQIYVVVAPCTKLSALIGWDLRRIALASFDGERGKCK
jgi:hypothetical protein